MEYVELFVKDITLLPQLYWKMHGFFNHQIKHSVNQFGIQVEPDYQGVVRKFRVFHPSDIGPFLKQPQLFKAFTSPQVIVDIGQIGENNQPIPVCAIQRDRQHEKSSPNKAMQRYEKSTRDAESVIRFKRKVEKYLTSSPPHIPIKSSQGHTFSLNLKSKTAQMNLKEIANQDFSFNAYGLSRGDQLIYLPLAPSTESN